MQKFIMLHDVSGRGQKERLVAVMDIKELSAGEEARYSAEFTPKKTGDYIIHAYLYGGRKRIGHKTNIVYAQKG